MPASEKTAISMQQQLFDDVNSLASELNISRSKLFVIAVEEFLKKNENKNMLSQINEAFADFPNERENSNTQIMKRKQKKILENDAW
jgi:metal-responsive CopG/Arc/MetJ family transcriptional regulator